MIHAFGGNVNVDVSDNIDIAADEGNAVMVQHADAHDAKLVMKAGGDISISSEEASGLLVGVLQEVCKFLCLSGPGRGREKSLPLVL